MEQPNHEAFLIRNPIDVLTSGEYNKVPMIIGYVSNEGAYASPLSNGSLPNPYVPPQIVLPDDVDVREMLLRKISATYQIDKNRTNEYLVSRKLQKSSLTFQQ